MSLSVSVSVYRLHNQSLARLVLRSVRLCPPGTENAEIKETIYRHTEIRHEI